LVVSRSREWSRHEHEPSEDVAMTATTFACVMSRSLLISTVVLLGVLVVVVGGMVGLFVWIGARAGWPGHFVKLAAIVLPITGLGILAVGLFSYLYSPTGYRVDARAITIVRSLSPVTIPLAEVKSIRKLVPGDLNGTLKTMGSDGLFGRIGYFHSPALGSFRMYTRGGDELLVVDAAERYVIAPVPADSFIATVTQRRGGRFGGAS
jgi:hypothetical protein